MRNHQLKRDIAAIRKAIGDRGYIRLRTWQPDAPTHSVAEAIGLVEEIPGIPQVQVLRPKDQASSTSNLYSGNFGRGAFPLHSDLAHWSIPPRYIMLRCIHPDSSAFTPIVPWSIALASVPSGLVQRARFRPRRQHERRTYLLPFMQHIDGNVLHRWDSLFIVSDNNAAAELTAHMTTLPSRIHQQIRLRAPGDTLIFDNWQVLHGRSAVPENSQRVLERVYLRELHVDG